MDPHIRPVFRRPRPATFGLLAAVLALIASSLAPPIDGAEAQEVREITLPIPAEYLDDVHWTDTWGAPRGGGRRHIGVDIMGEKMIPLVAVRSGTVTWGRYDNGRGSILRFRDAEGWEYQYIHLNNDTPGTDDGRASCTETFTARLCSAIVNGRFVDDITITEGEIIGYMGDGGNAEHTLPHLHFELYKPNGSGGVTPINPTASVDAARDRLLSGPDPISGDVPEEPVDPGDPHFVDQVWAHFHGRPPTAAERVAFERLDPLDALARELAGSPAVAAIDRLYLAYFGRYPDAEGLTYWVDQRGDGHSIEDIAEWFAASEESRLSPQSSDPDAFLDHLYREVLGRAPDEGGKAYWLDQLAAGEVTTGTIVVYFTEGAELRQQIGLRGELVALTLLRHDTSPTDGELSAWIALRADHTLAEALAHWYSV